MNENKKQLTEEQNRQLERNAKNICSTLSLFTFAATGALEVAKKIKPSNTSLHDVMAFYSNDWHWIGFIFSEYALCGWSY